MQKRFTDWTQKINPSEFEIILVDETHHFPAETWEKIIEHFHQSSKIIFFTATPYRNDRKRVIKGKPTFVLSREVALKKKIIRDIDIIECDDDDVCGSILLKVKEHLTLYDEKYQFNNGNHTCIVFVESITDSEKISEIATKLDMKSEVYNSSIKDRIKDTILKKFDNGEITLLIVSGCF
eukprot:gene6107-10114_t